VQGTKSAKRSKGFTRVSCGKKLHSAAARGERGAEYRNRENYFFGPDSEKMAVRAAFRSGTFHLILKTSIR
jgi:hypothetical protein